MLVNWVGHKFHSLWSKIKRDHFKNYINVQSSKQKYVSIIRRWELCSIAALAASTAAVTASTAATTATVAASTATLEIAVAKVFAEGALAATASTIAA